MFELTFLLYHFSDIQSMLFEKQIVDMANIRPAYMTLIYAGRVNLFMVLSWLRDDFYETRVFYVSYRVIRIPVIAHWSPVSAV